MEPDNSAVKAWEWRVQGVGVQWGNTETSVILPSMKLNLNIYMQRESTNMEK